MSYRLLGFLHQPVTISDDLLQIIADALAPNQTVHFADIEVAGLAVEEAVLVESRRRFDSLEALEDELRLHEVRIAIDLVLGEDPIGELVLAGDFGNQLAELFLREVVVALGTAFHDPDDGFLIVLHDRLTVRDVAVDAGRDTADTTRQFVGVLADLQLTGFVQPDAADVIVSHEFCQDVEFGDDVHCLILLIRF